MGKSNGIKIYSLSKENEINKNVVKSINNLLKILSPELSKINKNRLQQLIRSPLFELYLLEIAGEIIGMASLHYFDSLAKKSVWVEDVVIHPKHQGKGLGKKVMKHVVLQAKKKGVKHLDLTSSPHRTAANKLYKKLKFEQRKTNIYRLKIKK